MDSEDVLAAFEKIVGETELRHSLKELICRRGGDYDVEDYPHWLRLPSLEPVPVTSFRQVAILWALLIKSPLEATVVERLILSVEQKRALEGGKDHKELSPDRAAAALRADITKLREKLGTRALPRARGGRYRLMIPAGDHKLSVAITDPPLREEPAWTAWDDQFVAEWFERKVGYGTDAPELPVSGTATLAPPGSFVQVHVKTDRWYEQGSSPVAEGAWRTTLFLRENWPVSTTILVELCQRQGTSVQRVAHRTYRIKRGRAER